MSNLSDTFKYISHFRHAGHQVGRKVGDMLELLTYAAIANDQSILSRLHVEPKLFGFSDAGHKVEFVILDEESEVKNESSFVDDLGADSLDTVELVMALEEEFDTEIPDEEAEKITTVQAAIDYVVGASA